MMDIRRLKELVRLMVNNELTELDLRDNRLEGAVPPELAACHALRTLRLPAHVFFSLLQQGVFQQAGGQGGDEDEGEDEGEDDDDAALDDGDES